MRNIALRLSFDGTAYHGWQMQKRDLSVQETLQKALAAVCGHPVHVTGCGRTDAGVHALRYCANFRSECSIPINRLPLAVNSRLPSDIAVSDACEVTEDFNAVCSCLKKEYLYRIHNSRIRDPFMEKRACFYPAPLDAELMRQAAAAFEGTHDFAAVRSVGTETKTTVRTVFWCRVEAEGEHIGIRICADGFLYNMARAMVGTMVYASHGKILPSEIPALLQKGDRRLTGPTMPPQGLYMNRVWYEGPAGVMMLTGTDE
jgi:tRNA pseudouridine38-40 synthase